jgi:hypothetical protein
MPSEEHPLPIICTKDASRRTIARTEGPAILSRMPARVGCYDDPVRLAVARPASPSRLKPDARRSMAHPTLGVWFGGTRLGPSEGRGMSQQGFCISLFVSKAKSLPCSALFPPSGPANSSADMQQQGRPPASGGSPTSHIKQPTSLSPAPSEQPRGSVAEVRKSDLTNAIWEISVLERPYSH